MGITTNFRESADFSSVEDTCHRPWSVWTM